MRENLKDTPKLLKKIFLVVFFKNFLWVSKSMQFYRHQELSGILKKLIDHDLIRVLMFWNLDLNYQEKWYMYS